MRQLLALSLIATLAGSAHAQLSNQAVPQVPAATPMGSAAESAWGGYALPAQVPYQPTLPGECVQPAPMVMNPAWQAYPTGTPMPADGGNQAVMLDQMTPGVPPVAVPVDPGYLGTGEPDLKQSLIPPGSRNGFFQKIKGSATYMPAPDSLSIGWVDLRTDLVTALPFFTRENPIIITPSYTLHFLDGPANLNLPPRLNDAQIDFHVFRVFDNHWIADFAVTPGIFADDHSFDSSEALRINGRAVGVYAPTIDVKYALGVTYLDGGWAKIVPVAGVIYTPTDDVEYQLLFPTPKIAWRLNDWSPIPKRDERWVYVALDYGNQAWAIEQPNGEPDVLASRDYRVLFGIERRLVGGISHTVEIGYVFNRDLKVASVSGDDISQGSTVMLRVGVWY